MEPDKSRGLKHIQDKRKYKANSTKNPKYVASKTKPNLGSNLYRYEQEEATTDQSELMPDFTVLAGAPISKGKHFQTKSEKLLASETESTTLNELFTLNLEKLEESLMAVPFYKRMDIDKRHFLESQIKFMNSEAEEHRKSFTERQKSKIPQRALGKSSEEPEEILENLTLEDKIAVEDNSVVNVDTNVGREKDEELEKWLDDFLND